MPKLLLKNLVAQHNMIRKLKHVGENISWRRPDEKISHYARLMVLSDSASILDHGQLCFVSVILLYDRQSVSLFIFCPCGDTNPNVPSMSRVLLRY